MLDLLPQLWKGHFSDWLSLESDGIARLVPCQSILYHWLVVLPVQPILYAHSCAVLCLENLVST